MSTTQQSIFSSYEKDPKFYDEIFDEKGNVKQVYQTLFDLYSGHSSQDFAKLNEKAKTGTR